MAIRLWQSITRRRALAMGGSLAAALLGVRCGLPALLRHGPPLALRGELKAFVDGCFADVERARLWDLHAHLVGRGRGTECFVSAELESRLHPMKNFQFELYAAAAGLSLDDDVSDRAYLDRLLQLHRLANPHGKLMLMAFDMHVDSDGNEVRAHSEFYTPNSYVLQVAREHADVVACASVHPYRKDARLRLLEAIDAGARAVKWLPNAMGIDPADPRCDGFYQVLAERRVPLITHTGEEAAVDSREAQQLGDPERLARPLDIGVTVVAAHVATLGSCGGAACVDRLFKMMRQDRWSNNLWADISATTQFNRAGTALAKLLAASDLHARFVNGSDYPLPAVDPLVSTRYLVAHNLLSDEDRDLVNKVYAHNPLLFDYVLKRRVRHVQNGVTHRFSPQAFESARLFEAL
jgi:mannonate dehydratase